MLDISERGIKKFFKKNPRGWIILPRDAFHPYSENFPPNVAIKKILSQNFPDYYKQYKKLISGQILFSSCQMFYTDVQSFNEYCEWLFDLLFRLRHTVGDVNYPPVYKRYCAYIGERLITVFTERNQSAYKEVERCVDSGWLYRFLSRTAHKLKLNINAKYYVLIREFFRKYTHYQPAVSSWARE